MTKAEIISEVRDLVNEVSTDSGALLDDDNNLLRFINDAAEFVVLDLMPIMPGQFLQPETVTLVADQANYTLGATITASTIAFVDSDPDTITDSGSGFVTAGFEAGQTIEASGATTAANNIVFSIQSVAAGTITLAPTDSVTAEAATASITITQKNVFWQVYKIENNVTNESPTEIEIIDPLDKEYHTTVGETDATPKACYFEGDTLIFVPTPSTAHVDYAKVYLIRSEAITIATGGPVLIPYPAHRLIVYRAAALIAVMMEADMTPFMALYQQRLAKIERVWAEREQQKPRFVRESVTERTTMDSRERAFTDRDWI